MISRSAVESRDSGFVEARKACCLPAWRSAGCPGRPGLAKRRRSARCYESRISNPESRLQAGFTLIELLVVLVIVGVLAAALTLAVGSSSERQLDTAAERLQALIGHACDQAELSGREIGVSIAVDGYAFSRLDGNQWRPFGSEGELRARSWPQGLRIELTRDGRPLAPSLDGLPQLVCFSSGELTPFALALTLGDAPRYRLTGSDDGSVRSDRIGAAP